MAMALENNTLLTLYNNYIEQGSGAMDKKEFFQALLHFARSLTIAELMKDQALALKAQVKIGLVQYKAKNLHEAHQIYTEILKHADLLSEDDLVHVKNGLGLCNIKTGKFQEAGEIFEELVRSNNTVARRKAYNNMGLLYYHLHTFFDEECMDKSLQYFKMAYDLCGDDQLMQHKILRNIGIGFYEKKDYTTALRKLKESLLLSDDKVELASTLNELAKVYIELHDYDQASSNLREAEKILLSKNYRNLEELSRNIFVCGLLAKKQGRLETAFSNFQTALQGFVEKENYPEAILVCREIYNMYKGSNSERANLYLDQLQFYLNYLDPMDS